MHLQQNLRQVHNWHREDHERRKYDGEIDSDISSAPLKGALAPGVGQGHHEDGNKDQGLDEGQKTEAMESHGPGIQKDGLHIEMTKTSANM